MLYSLMLLVVILTIVQAGEKGQSCLTPDNRDGQCIPVRECKPIINFITSKNDSAIEFAKKSQCGFYDSHPLVCCEVWKSKFLPNKDVCGISISDRIIGGIAAQLAQYSWIVALEYIKKATGENVGIRCAGTLINNRYVVTAAKCLSDEEFELIRVRLGEHDLSSDPDCDAFVGAEKFCLDPVRSIKPNKIITHPKYDKVKGNDNIALVRLEDEIIYSESVSPVCLSNKIPDSETKEIYPIIAGWGTPRANDSLSNLLKHTPISPVSDDDCRKKMHNSELLNQNEFCGVQKYNTYPSLGNIGSPLMTISIESHMENFYLEGILTRNSIGDLDNPLVYIRILDYIPWVLETISSE